MPYVKQPVRDLLEQPIQTLLQSMSKVCDGHTINPGNLNYVITKLLLGHKPQTYADYNALIGALEACKLEFNRRAVAVYERKKCTDNGDVYPEPDASYYV